MAESIPLVRSNLRDLLRIADTAHPGLLIQRGWTDHVKTDANNGGEGGKTRHLERICNIPAPDVYTRAFERWKQATSDDKRFRCFEMKIANRLLIGLNGGGALETGCSVSQTYGMPYLPGSSVKGVAHVYTKESPNANPFVLAELFGCEPDKEEKLGLSGVVAFHDAWWVPDKKPFVMDVVTPHHPAYYTSEGKQAATDLDSPVPNAIIGVQGSFRFTLEGPPEWTKLAKRLLELALAERGIGAKTAAGYGYMEGKKPSALDSTLSDFVDAKLIWNAGSQKLEAILLDGKKTAPLMGQPALSMLENLSEETRNGKKLKEGKLLVEISVKKSGNLLEVINVREKISA